MSLPLGHSVHRPRRLDLLARSDSIAILKQLGERGTGTFSNRVLQLLWQISERDVRMDRLHVTQELIW